MRLHVSRKGIRGISSCPSRPGAAWCSGLDGCRSRLHRRRPSFVGIRDRSSPRSCAFPAFLQRASDCILSLSLRIARRADLRRSTTVPFFGLALVAPSVRARAFASRSLHDFFSLVFGEWTDVVPHLEMGGEPAQHGCFFFGCVFLLGCHVDVGGGRGGCGGGRLSLSIPPSPLREEGRKEGKGGEETGSLSIDRSIHRSRFPSRPIRMGGKRQKGIDPIRRRSLDPCLPFTKW